MKYKHPAPSSSAVWLGKRLERIRTLRGVGRREVAKLLKETEKKIVSMERGAFISLPRLELLGEFYGQPVDKKIIRKISNARKLEQEHDTSFDEELRALYEEAFQLDEEE